MTEREQRDLDDDTLLLDEDVVEEEVTSEDEDGAEAPEDGEAPDKRAEQLKASRRNEKRLLTELRARDRRIAAIEAALAEQQAERIEQRKAEIKDAETIAEMEFKRAHETADPDAIVSAERNLHKVRTARERVESQPKPQVPQGEDPAISRHREAFMSKNDWVSDLDEDSEEMELLKAKSLQLNRQGVSSTGPEHWKQLEEFAKKRLPEYFKGPQRPTTAGQRGGSPAASSNGKLAMPPRDVLAVWEKQMPEDPAERKAKLARLVKGYWKIQNEKDR